MLHERSKLQGSSSKHLRNIVFLKYTELALEDPKVLSRKLCFNRESLPEPLLSL